MYTAIYIYIHIEMALKFLSVANLNDMIYIHIYIYMHESRPTGAFVFFIQEPFVWPGLSVFIKSSKTMG